MALMLGLPVAAQAATFSVNDLNDAPLASHAQGCQSADDGLCTLRAALQAADLASGDTTVNLPAGTYELTRAQTADRSDDGSIGNLVVENASGDGTTNTVTINGAGAASTTIEGLWDLANGGVPDRVLEVIGGHGEQSTDQVDAQISGVTITGGDLRTPAVCDTPAGGGVLVADGATVILDRSTVSANQAAGDGGGIGVVDDDFCDGAASRTGTQPDVTVTDSTIASNTAGEDGGGFAGSGFGSYAFSGDTFSENTAGSNGGAYFGVSADAASFTNDTITGNVATNGDGGGISVSEPIESARPTDDGARPELEAVDVPTASLINDTVNANLAPDSGANLSASPGVISLENTIVAEGGAPQPPGNVSPQLDLATNCDGNVQSLGHNVFDNAGTDCGAVGSDVVSPAVGIGLDSLLPNGGPTDTEALQASSPAVGAADAAACPSGDQRGVTRGSPCDIGAFELDADLRVDGAATPNPSTVGTPTTFTFTVTNTGSDPASGTTLTVPIPANASLTSDASSAGSCSGTETVTCSLGDIGGSGATPGLASPALSGGATVTLTIVPTGGSSLSLTATTSSVVAHLSAADAASLTVTVPLQAAPATLPTPTPTSTTAVPVPPPVAAGGVKSVTTIVPAVRILPTTKSCTSQRDFLIHIQNVAKDHLVSAVIYVSGHRETTVRHHLSAAVDLRDLPYGTFVVRIVAHTRAGRAITGTRTYHTCRSRPLPPHKLLKL